MASIQITTTSHFIFPTQGDINGGVTRLGRAFIEYVLPKWRKRAAAGVGCVLEGFALAPSIAVGQAATSRALTAGYAIIDGYLIGTRELFDGTPNTAFSGISLPYARTFVWLRLGYTSGLATSVYLDITDGAYTPPNAILLGIVDTTGPGTTISAVNDRRFMGRRIVVKIPPDASVRTGYRNGDGTGDYTYSKGSGTSAVYTITWDEPFLRVPDVVQITPGTAGVRIPSNATSLAVDGLDGSHIWLEVIG